MLENVNLKPLVGLTLLWASVGCNSSPQNAANPNGETAPAAVETGVTLPSVVATTSIICDLTQQVAQETVNLNCLMEAGEDPHVYQPQPEDRKAIDTANLILYAGYDFDPSLVRLVEATSNPAPKIAVHQVAVPQPLMGEAHDHDHGNDNHNHDHDHDHSHGEELAPDPHVWHDPENGIQMVEVIAESLANLQPEKAELYQQNAEQIAAELAEIDGWIQSKISTIPPNQQKLVTTHDALGYYVNAYGLSYEGALQGFSTDEAPTASRVGELVREIQAANVPMIFAESTSNPQLLETVAKEANIQVAEQELYADGLGETGSDAETYQQMLKSNTRTIVEGLGGNYTPFTAQK